MTTTLPEGVSVVDKTSERSIAFRWHSWSSKWLLLFVIVSPIALGIGWQDFLTSWKAQLIVGVLDAVFLYVVIAGWCNSTTIRVEGSQLRAHHGPLPWPGNVELPQNSVRDIEVAEHYIQHENGERLTFRLMAIRPDGRRIKLATAFEKDDKASAEFVAATLKKWLKIGDGERNK
ncbi:MAG: hypothetical protein H6R18_1843 [Proteobacteria bacterium]|nr:hypothetical protein [Pseudomonadota bacterium]